MDPSKQSHGGVHEARADALEQEPIILVTTIDISPGVSQAVELRRNDVPVDVARQFCVEHGLGEDIVIPLTTHLQQHLEKAQLKQAQRLEPLLEAHDEESDGVSSTECSENGAVGRDPSSWHGSYSQGGGLSQGGISQGLGPVHRRPGVSVFNRLYARAAQQDAKVRQKAQQQQEDIRQRAKSAGLNAVSQRMAQQRCQGGFANYGEYLYTEGLTELDARRRRTEEAERERNDSEMEGHSFHPKISSLAAKLPRRDVPAWQRLGTQRARSQSEQKRAAYMQQSEEDLLRECSFHPKINDKSAKLMEERMEVLKEHNITAHEQLYQDSVRRQTRLEEYETWYPEDVTFAPSINERKAPTRVASADGSTTAGEATDAEAASLTEAPRLPASERLYEEGKRLRERMEQKRAEAASRVDATGRVLYQPEVGRAPRGRAKRNAAALPVGDYLYGLRNDAAERQEIRMQQEHAVAQKAAHPKASRHSRALLSALQRKRFCQIFDYLDEHRVGALDLLPCVLSSSERHSHLDNEVKADLEVGALLLAHRRGLLPQPALDTIHDAALRYSALLGAQAAEAAQPAGAQAPDESQQQPETAGGGGAEGGGAVGRAEFQEVMGDVLSVRRGVPRTYILPNAHPRFTDENLTFRPAINPNAEALARHLRPEGCPAYKQLFARASLTKDKLEAQRQHAQDEVLAQCTFQPLLVSEQRADHGRALGRSVDPSSRARTLRTHSMATSSMALHALAGGARHAAAGPNSHAGPQDRRRSASASSSGRREGSSLTGLAKQGQSDEDLYTQVEREVQELLAQSSSHDSLRTAPARNSRRPRAPLSHIQASSCSNGARAVPACAAPTYTRTESDCDGSAGSAGGSAAEQDTPGDSIDTRMHNPAYSGQSTDAYKFAGSLADLAGQGNSYQGPARNRTRASSATGSQTDSLHCASLPAAAALAESHQLLASLGSKLHDASELCLAGYVE